MQANVRSRQSRHAVTIRQRAQLRRKCTCLHDGHRQPLRRDRLDGCKALADESQPPRALDGIERLDRPFPEQAALRIKRKRQRLCCSTGMKCAGCPRSLFAPQEFALATSLRVHRDDEVIGLAEPCGHRRGEAGLHLDMDARIAGDEACQQRRNDAGAVIVHHAQPHHAFDLALGAACRRPLR